MPEINWIDVICLLGCVSDVPVIAGCNEAPPRCTQNINLEYIISVTPVMSILKKIIQKTATVADPSSRRV